MGESEESPSRWMASRPCWVLVAAAVARVAAAMMVFMVNWGDGGTKCCGLQVVSCSEGERISSESPNNLKDISYKKPFFRTRNIFYIGEIILIPRYVHYKKEVSMTSMNLLSSFLSRFSFYLSRKRDSGTRQKSSYF